MPKTTFIDAITTVGAEFLNKIFTHNHQGLDEDGSCPLINLNTESTCDFQQRRTNLQTGVRAWCTLTGLSSSGTIAYEVAPSVAPGAGLGAVGAPTRSSTGLYTVKFNWPLSWPPTSPPGILITPQHNTPVFAQCSAVSYGSSDLTVTVMCFDASGASVDPTRLTVAALWSTL